MKMKQVIEKNSKEVKNINKQLFDEVFKMYQHRKKLRDQEYKYYGGIR